MPFEVLETFLDNVKIITPNVFPDNRGVFFESFKESDYCSMGITEHFVQENHSISNKHVIRGLHFQKEPYAQGKLVQVAQGCIYDVVVDFNPSSETYKRWFGIMLSELNKKLLWIPPGYAHGFSVVSESAHVIYKCTKEYNPDAEDGIIYNDKELNINWFIQNPIVSQKDLLLPSLKSVNKLEDFI